MFNFQILIFFPVLSSNLCFHFEVLKCMQLPFITLLMSTVYMAVQRSSPGTNSYIHLLFVQLCDSESVKATSCKLVLKE